MPARPLPILPARDGLSADCSRCAGLCCVAPAFAAWADVAIDKPTGTPCRHLHDDFRGGIHDRPRPEAFPGCTVFDCFGAAQRINQQTFGGRTWRESPEVAAGQFAVMPVMRPLHEILWYLAEAATLPAAPALHLAVERARAATERLAGADVDELRALDVGADVPGAALSGCLFLTPPQLGAARGDAATALPPGLQRPGHWSQTCGPGR
jgi:hypothetical protein